jgi:hypothetical protein
MMSAGTAKVKKEVKAQVEGPIGLQQLLEEQADEQPDNVIMVDDSQTNVYTAPMHRT